MTKGQSSPTTDPSWENKLAPEGTGVRAFKPLAVALATGASFIARGFSGNPSGVTELIKQGIAHKGFSFLEVLSPCVTFQPEQKSWKQQVTAWDGQTCHDAGQAAGVLFNLSDFETGVFYQADALTWTPPRHAQRSVTDFGEAFKV
jgi:2-oxoglutarate ferredoxin oxidoreductase subunit beta